MSLPFPELGDPLPISADPGLLDILARRRSTPAQALGLPGPSPQQVRDLIALGARAPDHGKLAPWRLVIIEGDARSRAGARLAEIALRRHPALDEAGLDIERRQFLPAPLTIGVIFCPKQSAKAPELEQLLSAGNVCFNLVNAAFALGFSGKCIAFFDRASDGLGPHSGQQLVHRCWFLCHRVFKRKRGKRLVA